MSNSQNNIYLTLDQETIVALSTPKGNGAIAIIRFSGVNSVSIVDKISRLSSNKYLAELPTHTIHHGFVTNKITGQDVIEISCHNNQFIIDEIIELAIKNGARMAGHGEFTQRAFLNNKLDLIRAEAINDLINASTQLALRKSISQVKGSLSDFIIKIEQKILRVLALVEGSFEFFEEEKQDLDIDNLIITEIDEILKELNLLKVNFNQQQQIKNGIKIALIGQVNTGKSTLFNAILGAERAIVTQIAGTTRDVIESSIYRNGNFWQLTDTAGLRETNDFIEKEGIVRSLDQAKLSDVILLVLDISRDIETHELDVYEQLVKEYKDKIIVVANKIDCVRLSLIQDSVFYKNKNIFGSNILAVSAKDKTGLDILEKEIEN
ncbi:tRNA uridine-5-carboxymethylaminomethyl(34) synthesis GTPase MnmE, partial [Candidatus Dependentiae bacterium]|nr:tRNA uridine-5-carboxymethylaminomethyl(34) synthesis GTPase MnmE [Candidatus Dependentiae bacterium]